MTESKKQLSAADTIEQIEAVLAAQRSQRKSWAGNLAMLALSLFLFVSAGLFKATFSGVMIIVLVLFIHELGHWIGMKIFRYRDVQMFFIPFFGAAVSGSESNPSGAKRAIVSLLGPLPGLAIGVVCGAFYLLSGTLFAEGGLAVFRSPQEIYAELARTFLFINAFNLLPILPLDGGRVLEDLLFSRSAKIALLFQIFTVLALAGLALALSSVVLGILAFFELASLKATYRKNQIVMELRQELSNVAPEAGAHIPRNYLARILLRLESTLPAEHQTPNLLAQHAQAIWQKIRCQAPQIGATIGLMLLYLFSLVGGVLLTLGFEFLARKPTSLGERVWERPSDNSKIEATILEMRPLLYADMSLKELAATSRGQHQAFDDALELIDSGKLRQAHEVLDSVCVDTAATNNPWYWILFAYAKQQLEDLAGSRECARKILALPVPESRTLLLACGILRELGEKLDDEITNHVYGVIIEIGVDSTIVIVAGYEDGSSRLLLGTGTGVFGEKEDFPKETIVAAKNLVQTAKTLVSQTIFEEKRQLPSQGQVRFKFLTGAGIRGLDARLERLEEESDHALHSLWIAAQELRAQLQKFMAEKMKQ
jgi:Zn-dependent protease